ncbi:MAG: hypothetical protein K6G39_07890 [Bacteroidales bacterium]|nr:hypothetical protein [Bacteroidales bacterium]
MKPEDLPSFTSQPARRSAGETPQQASEKKPAHVREDGLTEADFGAGDIVAWEAVSGPVGGKIVLMSGGEKVVMTNSSRCIPLRDVILSPSLRKLN